VSPPPVVTDPGAVDRICDFMNKVWFLEADTAQFHFEQDDDTLHVVVIDSHGVGYHYIWLWCGDDWFLYRFLVILDADDYEGRLDDEDSSPDDQCG